MARTVKQWRKEMLIECEMVGATKVAFEPTGGTHQRIIVTIGAHSFDLISSMSPSDHRSHLNFRTILRRKVRELGLPISKGK